MIQSASSPVPDTLWDPRFDLWATEPSSPVSRELVHKRRTENVLVSRVEAADEQSDENARIFAVQLHFPPEHPFFFEHPVDHVPGLALIEAGRQVGLAIAHSFFDVPLEGFSFFMNGLGIDFTSFAALDRPVFGRGEIREVTRRRGRVHSMEFTGYILQDRRTVGTMRGTWTIVPTAVMDRMRRER